MSTKQIVKGIVPKGFVHTGVRPSKREFTYRENLNAVKVAGANGRSYQKQGVLNLKGHPLTIYVSPTGSGKTIVQNTLAGHDLISNSFKRKQLFIAPQRNIGNNFSMEYIDAEGNKQFSRIDIDGSSYKWKISENYCELVNKKSESNIRAFLLGKTPDAKFANRMKSLKILDHGLAVCCYPTLVAVWKNLTASEKKFVARTTAVRIDEVHHLRLDGHDDDGCNQLGRVIRELISLSGHLHCTTATMFRGDRASILHNLDLGKFKQYKVDWMTFWKSTGIDRLSMNFSAFSDGKDLLNILEQTVKKEKAQKHIIIVPSDNTGIFKNTDKVAWVKQLVRKMKTIYGSNRVLDLIYNQDSDKQRLLVENKDFDCVVTCMIGREGTDWPACSRVHNLVLDRNVLQPIQKMGRATRRYQLKHNIVMTCYIEHFTDWENDGDELKNKFTDYFNAILAMSIYDDLFYPIKLPVIRPPVDNVSKDSDDENENEDEDAGGVDLQDVFEIEKYHQIKTEVYQLVTMLASKDIKDADEIKEEIESIVKKYEKYMIIPVPRDELVAALYIDVARRCDATNKQIRTGIDGYASSWIRREGFETIFKNNIKGKSFFEGTASTNLMQRMGKFFKQQHDRFSQEKLKDFVRQYVNVFLDIHERIPTNPELSRIIDAVNNAARKLGRVPRDRKIIDPIIREVVKPIKRRSSRGKKNKTT